MNPILRACYRALLACAPVDVRRANAAEMEAALEESLALEQARRPRGLRWTASIHALADAALFVAGAHRDPRDIPACEPPHRRPSVIYRDIRDTLRLLRTQPAMTAAIVGMFALGIGATTAIFSVVYGVLLRPLPFPEPDRLVQIWGTRLDRGWTQVSLTEADLWDLHDRNRTFAEIGGYHPASFSLTGIGLPERVTAAQVTAGFFPSLGLPPAAGRLFERGEDTPGHPDTVVLSNALWRRRFDGSNAVVGRTLTLDGRPYTVIGVAAAGTPWLDSADLFVPLVRRADPNRSSFEFVATGRLKADATFDSAAADLAAIARQLADAYPKSNTGLGLTIAPSRAWVASDDLRRTLWVLLGAVGLLLTIACVNVTNLLLARASSRSRDSAVRTALGATRADLLRERITESLVYSVGGTLLGIALARWMIAAVQSIDPRGIPRLAEVGLNLPVLGFAAAVAVVTGLAAGIVPALSQPFSNVAGALRPSQRGVGDAGHTRLRNALVVAEVSLSLVLLIGTGLLVRSLLNVLTVERGFQTDNRMLITLSIPSSYEPARIEQETKQVLERIGTIPGVSGVAAVSGRPLSPSSTGMGIAAADKPDVSGADVPWATWRIVTADYFKVMGIPLVAGRRFTDSEEIGKPWRVVISKRTAELLWPGEPAVGRTAILWKGQSNNRAEVIGVVGDMRERGLDRDPTLAVYFPSAGAPRTTVQLALHSAVPPQQLLPAIRTTVAAVDPNLPVSNARTLDEVVSASVATRRLTALLLVTFASLALVLALAGVYGVLAYSVARRTPEIGVRLALGAEHRGLLRLVVAQGMRPVLAGIALGVAGAWWASKLMANLLFGLGAGDPATYACVAAITAVVAAAACYLPARRVLRVDPVVALRAE